MRPVGELRDFGESIYVRSLLGPVHPSFRALSSLRSDVISSITILSLYSGIKTVYGGEGDTAGGGTTFKEPHPVFAVSFL